MGGFGINPDFMSPEEKLHFAMGIHPSQLGPLPTPEAQPAVAPSAPTPSIAKATDMLPTGISLPSAESVPHEQPNVPVPSIASPQLSNQGQHENERARLEREGSGVHQFSQEHHILGPIARAGDIALSTLFPGVASLVPGTTAHHNGLIGQQNQAIDTDIGQDQETAKTGEMQARGNEQNAQAEAIKNPQPKAKEEKWGEFAGYTDADGTPLIREGNSGQVVRASDKQPATGFKATAAKQEKPDSPEQQFIDSETAKGIPLAQAIADYAKASQKPERPGNPSARGDKSYTYNNDKLDKLGKPIEDAVGRMGRLRDTLAQGTPQADALVAPELLTIMAGGAGSGLRMNEAEIQRIVGGRSVWENLKANMQHWSTDPEAARSITPDQQKQIRTLVDAVNAKLQKKQQALDQAREHLLDSDDPKEHRRIVTDAHHALTQVDEGQPDEGGGMVKMKAPDGTIKPVPADQVDHYKKLGAQVAQ